MELQRLISEITHVLLLFFLLYDKTNDKPVIALFVKGAITAISINLLVLEK
jgi:hypothetical protein